VTVKACHPVKKFIQRLGTEGILGMTNQRKSFRLSGRTIQLGKASPARGVICRTSRRGNSSGAGSRVDSNEP